jgi:hypothetical protein
MATGFTSNEQKKTKKSTGYKTIFERISEATNGESKSFEWYRSRVASLASEYKKDPAKLFRQENIDRATGNSDGNVLRRFPVEGHLYFYEYKAKMKWLPYYDTFPLVYVVKGISDNEFIGANLHYIQPKKRVKVIQELRSGRVDIPKSCFHKYIHNHVEGWMLDLHIDEWDTAILLPVENFIRDIKGYKFPYKKEDVWKETNDKYYDKIKGHRMIKGYGTKESKEMVQ